MAGRTACVLVAVLLTFASTGHAQVIDEGGFPVKGGDNYDDPLSLSCPSHLYVESGESVLLSCAAAGVSEEGIRYEWRSLSDEGLHLLSDGQSHAPLFTAPVSGASEEYAYRLTATGPGVYASASVTVTVAGVSGESVRAPGLQEECDPLTIPDEPGQGCAPWEREPDPFGFGFEEEGGFPLPESPGPPDRGGGFDSQAPPRLDCPAAVFLEELETGQIGCHAWDAAGEEYLEYSWEPVGSTTRDYMDNPRLIPEDSPHPVVVAPEAPVYETLESFLSEDRTSVYRYRLTATSRATGLSSSSEVEVYVSSSRPGVYCPLEVVVEEGETVALDCEGADPLSFRVDYDEEAASVLWEWEGLWGASTDPLDATDLSSPLFTAPPGSAGEEYHYIASMTTSASGAPRTARRRVTVRVRDTAPLELPDFMTCNETNYVVYVGDADFQFDCVPNGTHPNDTWRWEAGPDSNFPKDTLAKYIPARAEEERATGEFLHFDPWFLVPDSFPESLPPGVEIAVYQYDICLFRDVFDPDVGPYRDLEHELVTVKVHKGKREPPVVTCKNEEVYEGAADFTLNCSVENEPSDATYSWAGTDIASRLRNTSTLQPTFSVPPNVNSNTDYEYTVTLSASGIDAVTEEVTVRVLNKKPLDVTCAMPSPVYEGSPDFDLDCSASGEPSGSTIAYEWTARGSTSNTSKLIADTDTPTPTFDVPDEVAAEETYEYMLTVTAENAEPDSAHVTVTVLNKAPLTVACTPPDPVYEGSEDIAFECEASGAPAGSDYTYAWTTGGDTQDTSLLSAVDIASPTFHVPDDVAATTTYEYLLTVTAHGAEEAMVVVAVTVLNRDALAATCADPGSVYEGAADIAFDCEASGAPAGTAYTYAWTARGDTRDTSLLSAVDIASPTFLVPDEVAATTTYEYLLTVSAANAENGTARVSVTVLNRGALAVLCADPGSVYEGSEDIAFDCEASGASAGSNYAYVWTARGDTQDTSLLSAVDIASPTFLVPEEVSATTTYEYLLTVSAANAESGTASVAVTVLNRGALAVACADPGSVYEGSEDIAFDCEASGAPAGSDYSYAWTVRGNTANTDLLSATDIASPTFYVPDEVAATTTYEYLLTVSAANAESGTARVAVTVLNRGALAVVCADPGSVYEGSEDIAFDCEASGAPAGSNYAYAWTARGDTQDTSLLSAVDIASPTFLVPDDVTSTTTYEYLLTVSAENAESGTAEVSVTVLDKPALAVTCADPGSVYEGSEDVMFDCEASGAPAGSAYEYTWTVRGDTQDTGLLSATDIASPTFYVPDEVAATTTYEYLLTVSAANTESGTAEVSVTVLDKPVLAVTCADPGSVYEGSEDVMFDCEASGAPAGSGYEYAWTARGDTQDTGLLSATDIPSPTFHVPDEVAATTTYEYLLTASAANAEDGTAEVTVTVLNKPALAVTCADPGSVYEGSDDIAFDCTATGAPAGSAYEYAWTARGDTQDTSLLSASDIASPIFYVPAEVDEDETYEYLLTVSAENAEDATAEVTVTVLDRAVAPPSEPVSPPVDTSPPEPVSPPLASSSSARDPSDPTALGVTVSASPLRFGVQSADTEVSLDPMTDGISTYVSGPYHGGRMTLAPGGDEATGENGEMNLSIELTSPVVLKREGGTEDAPVILTPIWSYAESCEQLSSQTIGSLYTEVTLSGSDCRLLRFGGEIDLRGAPSGQYSGNMDLVLRSGEREETHSVEVGVTVVPSQRVITIGPGGVRFSTLREVPVALTEEQNLSIYPDVAFLTREQPHGVFELSNPSLIPLEISVSARFGYTEATQTGREVVVEDASESDLGDLSEVVDIHPGVLVLMPGEKGFIRYGMKEEAHAALAEQGYAAFFDVVSVPRRYADMDRMPEEVTGERTARVTMRVPGVYVPKEGASQLRATLSSISYVDSLSATFLLETADHPFAGEVIAYDGDGRELGRTETLVYTRSRVRIPLDRMPEEGSVFLRFMPRGSGRAPLPASVEWNAPVRDIGAAEEEGRTTPPATLARKP